MDKYEPQIEKVTAEEIDARFGSGASACPKCGWRSGVDQTRPQLDGKTRRHRICLNPHCLEYFVTYEGRG